MEKTRLLAAVGVLGAAAAPANPAPASTPAPAPAAAPLTNPSAVVTQFYQDTTSQLDGTLKTYSGTYTVQNGVIVSANITQIS